MTRYASFHAVQSIKCEWCGTRATTDHAIMEASTRQCYCSEDCFTHAGGLARALRIAQLSPVTHTYTGARGVAEQAQRTASPLWTPDLSSKTFDELVAEVLRPFNIKLHHNEIHHQRRTPTRCPGR